MANDYHSDDNQTSASPLLEFPTAVLEDLANSGLSETTIINLGIHITTPEERNLLGLRTTDSTGYTIPYYPTHPGTPWGPIDYFRMRAIPAHTLPDGRTAKYRQPKETPNHLYIPPTLDRSILLDPTLPLVITEGEKKAAAAVQAGIPCVAIGGVYSWRTRTLTVKNLHLVKKDGKKTTIRFDESEGDITPEIGQIQERIVPELFEIPLDSRKVFICFDSDIAHNRDMQLALFNLAYWLWGEGAEVRAIWLPSLGPSDPETQQPSKTGLDDFLLTYDAAAFWRLPLVQPEPPNLRGWIRKVLNSKGISARKEGLRCCRAIIASLDKNGKRYLDAHRQDPMYLDQTDNRLYLYDTSRDGTPPVDKPEAFGSMLANRYGLSGYDNQIAREVSREFIHEEGLEEVIPHHILTTVDDALYYQCSDTELIKVTEDGLEVVPNGFDGQLFLANSVMPIDPALILDAYRNHLPPHPIWFEDLQDTTLQPYPGMSIEASIGILGTNYYLSPWFNRYRGIIVPFEQYIAEANSGKSFLCQLRRGVLTGNPSLKEVKDDMLEMVTMIVNTHALCVMDNANIIYNKGLFNMISAFINRMITEPYPVASRRRLYTTADEQTFPIFCTLAATSQTTVFNAPDTLKRSLTNRFTAVIDGLRLGNWLASRIAPVSRAIRLADQFRYSQKFLREARLDWDPDQGSSSRLPFWGLGMRLMGRGLGIEDGTMAGWLGDLENSLSIEVGETVDPIYALRTFVIEWHQAGNSHEGITPSDILNWARYDLESRFTKVPEFENSITLGRFFSSHQDQIRQSTALARSGKRYRNAVCYKIHSERLEHILRILKDSDRA